MLRFMLQVGYNPDKITFIHISGWVGDNMIEPSSNMGWYKGMTLIESLGNLESPKRPTEKPLRLPLQDVYKIGGMRNQNVGFAVD